jgi:hypothetical protein
VTATHTALDVARRSPKSCGSRADYWLFAYANLPIDCHPSKKGGPMSRQIFIHIGGEKTGTTTLQRFLTRNTSELKKAGFFYPCEAHNICFESIAHFPIAASLVGQRVEFVSEKRQRTLPLVLGALTRLVESTDAPVILSCEHFSSRLTQADQLTMLRAALRTDDIKIIYYIREPSDLSLAAWSTGVRCGRTKAFNASDVTPENRYFNHLEPLKLWGSIFGDSNIIVREYNRSRLIGGDIRKDFCELLEIELPRAQFENDENQSFDSQRLQVLSYVNCGLSQFHESENGWRRAQKLREIISTHIPCGESLNGSMSEQERTDIKLRFSEINREISERYFDGRLSHDWFPDRNAEDPGIGSHSQSLDDITSILRETVIRIADTCSDYEMRLREVRPKRRRKLHKLLKRLRRRFFQSDSRATAQP